MWQYKTGPDGDIVISTRVRLARNIKDIKFPHLMNDNDIKKVKEIVKNAIEDIKELKYFELKDIEDITKLSLTEKHIISKELLDTKEKSAIILNSDTSIAIMVNEEDHLRMQSFKSGFDIYNAYKQINQIDNKICKKIDIAYLDKYGYLTSCPTNVGCALRVSIMLHLPGLVKTRYIERLLEEANSMGIVIRGIYGENTKSIGDLFQISGQKTLGKTEEEILENIHSVISNIILEERKARLLLLEQKEEFEDKIYRAYGILKNARIMTSKEAHKLLSDIKLGANLNILKDVDISTINELIININSYTLQEVLKKEMDQYERDITRAKYIRERLGGK